MGFNSGFKGLNLKILLLFMLESATSKNTKPDFCWLYFACCYLCWQEWLQVLVTVCASTLKQCAVNTVRHLKERGNKN